MLICSQLQQKVKSLISENEELVTQKEYFETQSEQVVKKTYMYTIFLYSFIINTVGNTQNNQVYSRHQAELQAQIKTKEVRAYVHTRVD